MSSTSWTIQRTKRKQPTITPASRKRVRISDDVGSSNSTKAKRKNQKTLTQIQWVNSPSTNVEDDVDLQEIGLDKERRTRTNGTRRAMLKKRDSTLTQMDWLGEFEVHKDDTIDDSALLPEENKSGADRIRQLDGSSATPIRQPSAQHHRSSSPSSIDHETQDYFPTQMPDMSTVTDTPRTSHRRRSARIASKTYTSPSNYSGYTSLARSPVVAQQPEPKTQHKPNLEVMGSVDSYNEQTPIQESFRPQTPRRRREIPSSQTPETMTRSKKRTQQDSYQSPSKRSARKPLGEKSTNIPSKSYAQGLETSKSLLKNGKPSPKRRKICVLKVPSKKLLPRPQYVDDSQRDVFSLQATSSSSPRNSIVSSPTKDVVENVQSKIVAEEPVEIASTSQKKGSSEDEIPSSPPVLQDSLPELGDLLLPSQAAEIPAILDRPFASQYHQANGEDSTAVHDFGRSHSQKEATTVAELRRNNHESNTNDKDGDMMLLDQETVNVQRAGSQSHPSVILQGNADEEDDDFGSPLANDTQFNVGLQERTSSPILNAGSKANQEWKPSNEHQSPATPTKSRPETRSDQYDNDDAEDNETEIGTDTPIPVPRLVERLGSIHSPETSDDMMLTGSRNRLSAAQNSTNNTTITKVPLNDTLHTSSSSSPYLPPVKSTTQRSVHPASLPHPSQISTQEPTQNYFPSSMPPPTQYNNEAERITIKDSSSVRLSQVPPYETQSQGLNLQLVNGSDDEIDDLDLDPASSTPYGRPSARKLFHLQRNETGSSLRSIHPHSDGSSGQSTHANRSSSPLSKGKTSHFVGGDQYKPRAKQATREKPNKPGIDETIRDSDETSSVSSLDPPPLKRKYDPLPGFDNETQSNFTQTGHITAAYVHRQRETGAWPDWFVPEPFQLSDWKRPAKRASSKKRKRT